jgi:hypothetical protein
VAVREELEIEFVGGPQDGKVITIHIPQFLDGAPEWVQTPADRTLGHLTWGQRLPSGTVVDRYRAPDGNDELAAAEAAYENGEPVKYRYAGQSVAP